MSNLITQIFTWMCPLLLNHKRFIWDKHKNFVPLSCTYTSNDHSFNINKCKTQTPDVYCPQSIPHFESWQPKLLGHTSIVPNLCHGVQTAALPRGHAATHTYCGKLKQWFWQLMNVTNESVFHPIYTILKAQKLWNSLK